MHAQVLLQYMGQVMRGPAVQCDRRDGSRRGGGGSRGRAARRGVAVLSTQGLAALRSINQHRHPCNIGMQHFSSIQPRSRSR